MRETRWLLASIARAHHTLTVEERAFLGRVARHLELPQRVIDAALPRPIALD